ncbi:MAG: LysE family translocator [Flavobacteriaceae bacterium]|nr:LysE family translocator [Flavobacteriaceae bacterium]
MEFILTFIIASFLMALSPGPDNIFVLSNTLYNGKKAGLFTVLGLVTGCLFHTTLVAFGVSEIISFNQNIFLFIKILGFSYMLILAFRVYKSPLFFEITKVKKINKSNSNNFITGLLMNILNPKVYFFFLSFFPSFLFLSSDELNLVSQFYILGLLFMLTTAIVFCSIVLFSTVISRYLIDFKIFHIVMKWIQILIFIAIATAILFSV